MRICLAIKSLYPKPIDRAKKDVFPFHVKEGLIPALLSFESHKTSNFNAPMFLTNVKILKNINPPYTPHVVILTI